MYYNTSEIKHLLVRCWDLAVVRPFSSFARLFPLHQRVYVSLGAVECGTLRDVTPSHVIKIRENERHAPPLATKQHTTQQLGTPCVKPPTRDIPSKHKHVDAMSSFVYLSVIKLQEMSSFSSRPTKKRIKLLRNIFKILVSVKYYLKDVYIITYV